MGDEVVYFVQGHKLYVDAVRTKKQYSINTRDLPWTKLTLKVSNLTLVFYTKCWKFILL